MLLQGAMEAEVEVEKVVAGVVVKLKSIGLTFVMMAEDPVGVVAHLVVKEDKEDLGALAVEVRLVFIVLIQILEL